jgi:hypothetical protein
VGSACSLLLEIRSPACHPQEAKQREREERQRAAAERAAKLAADAKQRAAKSKQLYKKTGHGQPVMKYRVEKMLQQLQSGQS